MDIKHYYIEKGTGQNIILLHGNGENSDYFAGQIDEFAKRYHVYALDTRGHGKTPRGDAPFTIRQFADDLKDFMDEHEITKAHILGFSDGANIAMIFAMKYPEMVDRLILNGGNLDAKGVKRSVQIPIEIGYKFASKFADKSESAKRNAQMLSLMVNDPNIRSEQLSAIRAKTLVIAGTNDMILRKETCRIAENIKDSKLVFVKGNHFIANKNPEEFNLEVINFIEN
ncbi:MAG: alpha/beta hydrolase [Lachnospiraceae bacterium]|jgi:pimeloyl-ACP methyl ester carboxylesterase|nr:alpha/beta hydrolase [Lachnospiraceae bacterium]MCR4866272.1 alpha/beta hydrolase [Lachnospiraceae bacterium]